MEGKSNIYRGATLFPWQKAVAKEICDQRHSGKVVVVKAHRQAGKSLMCENILLYYAINQKGSKNAIISPVLSQSRKIFREIVSAIEDSGIIKHKNETLLELTLINKSSIIFRSAEMRDTLRGETITGILIWDEAAYLNEDIAEYTLPWLQVNKSPLLIVSTPKLRAGLYYTYYEQGVQGVGNTVSIDWNDYDTSELLSEDIKEQYKKILTKNQYKSEILGEFLDDEGMVFSHFRECVKPALISDTDKLFVGIDWSNQSNNDDTVLSVINDKGQQVILKYWNNLTPLGQVDVISSELRKIEKQIVLIQPELNSIGTPYTDLLKERLQPSTRTKVEGFQTTNQSKADIVSNLQVAFEQGEITILDDEKQLSELGVYAADYNLKTKNITYNAPQGLHDDICIALMLSWDAYRKKNARGNYSIGITKTRMRIR